MRKIAYLVIPMVGLVFVACENRAEREQAEQATQPAETPAPATPTPDPNTPLFTVDVTGKGTGSTITGQVRVLPGIDPNTGFRIAVDLNNLPEGQHDWHIHQGSCDTNGPVVVPITADKDKSGISQPLQGGTAPTTAQVDVPATMLTADQLRSGDYSLHVHAKSDPTNHGPTIACSNLKG
jgi:Cu/Zn superoxide dismutase